ncbi:DUF6924 domain-containing protein [Nocardia sp. NPDC058666]|uniref:DUF6924 domain-containing protein n=1 Tax=unclassified Nocardia TaxID=2637762 RepID=UPI00366602B9
MAQVVAAVIAFYDEDAEAGLASVDDVTFDGLTPAELADLVGRTGVLFIADSATLSAPSIRCWPSIPATRTSEATVDPTFRSHRQRWPESR